MANIKKLQKFALEVDSANKQLISFMAALINRQEDKTFEISFDEFEGIKGKRFDVSYGENVVYLKLL